MTERLDNVISMQDYLEGKKKPDVVAIRKRLADIGLEQLLLASERNRLLGELKKAGEQET